jgi:hypothetical protein
MKTMPILIAMLLAGSAFAETPMEEFQRNVAQTQIEIATRPVVVVQQPVSTPSSITVMEVNPGVWKGSDGSTIRDMGPLGYTISKP